MKFLGVLIRRYILTLLTLILILCLTFYKPSGIKRTDTIIEIDKVVHFLMYFTLCAVFWYENFKVNLRPRVLPMAVFAVIVPVVFSGVMEYLQYKLTSYRTGDLADFVFNTVGVFTALLFSLFVTRPFMVKRSKKTKQ
ncbi:MAG: VanZ family protein [Bacteroidaceae bacterium]|nr:VanZ family protein [Bacteroidaceae bacterium]